MPLDIAHDALAMVDYGAGAGALLLCDDTACARARDFAGRARRLFPTSGL